jgi:hypothetical protein
MILVGTDSHTRMLDVKSSMIFDNGISSNEGRDKEYEDG